MPPATSSAELGRSLLHDHLLAFEVVSMLLLAVMVGAIVIARRRDPGAEVPRARALDRSTTAVPAAEGAE
jgi:hypothetical protein